MGVLPSLQRSGIGKALLRTAEEYAATLGMKKLCVYTLGDGVEYPPYERTRRFYYSNGFRVYKRSQTDNPGCPEEIWLEKEIPI
jgi:GNAT superfamily N-acetyltransferase